MKRAAIAAALLLVFAAGACRPGHNGRIVVGSKNFTEQVVLAELMAQQIEAHMHVLVERRFYLGGSYIAHQAVLNGRIDLYPEYTGTVLTAILKEQPRSDATAVYARVREEYDRRFHLAVLPSLGFNNSFAMVMRSDQAKRLGVTKLSQLSADANKLRFGCGYEFLERPDGFKGFSSRYDLRFAAVPRVMDLGLLYRALTNNEVDVIAANSTDGLIAALGLTVLEDDLHYFPPYEAVPVVNEGTLRRYPQLRSVLEQLAGKVSEDDIRRMNYALDGEHRDVGEVVADFRKRKGL